MGLALLNVFVLLWYTVQHTLVLVGAYMCDGYCQVKHAIYIVCCMINNIIIHVVRHLNSLMQE